MIKTEILFLKTLKFYIFRHLMVHCHWVH